MPLMHFLTLFCLRHKKCCFHYKAETQSAKAQEIPSSCFELEWGTLETEKLRNILSVYSHSKEIDSSPKLETAQSQLKLSQLGRGMTKQQRFSSSFLFLFFFFDNKWFYSKVMIFGSYKLKHSKAQANYLSIRKVIGHCKLRCAI